MTRGDSEKPAAAETAFVVAAKRALPQAAFDELFSLHAEDVPRWAEKWRVNAPCMVEHSRELLALAACLPGRDAQKMQRRSLAVDRGFRHQVPREWLSELARLDALRPSLLRESVLDKVESTHAKEYRKSKLGDDPDLLARLSADPWLETRRHFISRAEDHYTARALVLKRVGKRSGFSPVAPRSWPELNTHIDWVVRFQLRDEKFTAIARTARRDRMTVVNGVRRLAQLIGLPLRSTRPGRPPARRKIATTG